jgi:hypothetical protein
VPALQSEVMPLPRKDFRENPGSSAEEYNILSVTQIHLDPRKAMRPLILGLLFITMGFLQWYYGPSLEQQGIPYFGAIIHFAGLIGIIFFGPLTIALIWRFIRRKPVLSLAPDGVIAGPMKIQWDEITAVDIAEYYRQKLLIFKLADPEKLLSSFGLIRRILGRMNLRKLGSPVAFPTSTLAIDTNELINLIERYHAIYAPTRASSGLR